MFRDHDYLFRRHCSCPENDWEPSEEDSSSTQRLHIKEETLHTNELRLPCVIMKNIALRFAIWLKEKML